FSPHAVAFVADGTRGSEPIKPCRKGSNMSKRYVTATAIALAALTITAAGASAQGRIRTGVLDCRGAGTTSFIVGSSHQFLCIFLRARAVRPRSAGGGQRVGRGGGAAQGAAGGGCVPPRKNQVPPADLTGNYAGVTAGAAFGVGANANALVGGSNNSFAL